MTKKTPDIYRIVDPHTRKAVEIGFANREEAKIRRDKLCGKDGLPKKSRPGRYIVSRGEDHPHGPSDGRTSLVRGKNSRW